MGGNEILTLQFGHYSNFVGAHWWNLQEKSFSYDPDKPSEINNDVLYREGVNLKSEVTFTPRLLLVDLKGSLRGLPQQGELYHVTQESNNSDYEVIRQEKVEKNDFQTDLDQGVFQSGRSYNLDDKVKVWSDFLYTRFHPRSVNIIQEYQHSDDKNPFDIYPQGANLWKSEQFCEDFADKIRNYIEECDSFQGFHNIFDASDAFSGLSISCLEYLRDEYPTKSILSFPVNLQHSPLHDINLILTYAGLAEHTSLFVPLSPTNHHYPNFNPSLPYHTSALIAATLDTLTLSYRLRKTKHNLIDICHDLTPNGRKGAAASLTLPFPLPSNQQLIDCLDTWQGPLTQSVTPDCQISYDDSLHVVTLRGIPESRLKGDDRQRHLQAYKCQTVKDMMSFYLECCSSGGRSEVVTCREGMKVDSPFPGFLGAGPVSVLSGLHSGDWVGKMFDWSVGRVGRFHRFQEEGLEEDSFKECLEKVLVLRDCYTNDFLV